MYVYIYIEAPNNFLPAHLCPKVPPTKRAHFLFQAFLPSFLSLFLSIRDGPVAERGGRVGAGKKEWGRGALTDEIRQSAVRLGWRGAVTQDRVNYHSIVTSFSRIKTGRYLAL